MQYREYKTAGQRHIDTCEKLIKHLQNVGHDLNRLQELTRIRENTIKNVFYLSGYVVECSVFYHFFTTISSLSPYTASVYDLNNRNNRGTNIGFGSHISNHFRFTTRPAWDRNSRTIVPEDKGRKSRDIITYIHRQSSTILSGTILNTLLTGNSPYATGKLLLAQEWDPDTRYQVTFNLYENDCLEYFKEAKKIFNRLT